MGEVELREVYADTILDLAKKNEDVFVIESDLASSIGTVSFNEHIGKRFVNIGIMEAEAVGVTSGISLIGGFPFYHTFAPFASRRAYDQVFLSLGYAGNEAVILGSDPGINALANGGTHTAFEDLALMRAIPNMTIYDVSEPNQMKKVLIDSYQKRQLTYIRSARKAYENKTEYEELDLDKGYSILKKGTDLTIFVSGILCEEALESADNLSKKGISAAVIEIFKIKPINEEIIIDAAESGPIVTVDNHNVTGGLGSAISEVVSENYPTLINRVGVRNRFGQVGTLDYLKEEYNLLAKDITAAAKTVLKKFQKNNLK